MIQPGIRLSQPGSLRDSSNSFSTPITSFHPKPITHKQVRFRVPLEDPPILASSVDILHDSLRDQEDVGDEGNAEDKEPNWYDLEASRVWLENRFRLRHSRLGSPLLQYMTACIDSSNPYPDHSGLKYLRSMLSESDDKRWKKIQPYSGFHYERGRKILYPDPEPTESQIGSPPASTADIRPLRDSEIPNVGQTRANCEALVAASRTGPANIPINDTAEQPLDQTFMINGLDSSHRKRTADDAQFESSSSPSIKKLRTTLGAAGPGIFFSAMEAVKQTSLDHGMIARHSHTSFQGEQPHYDQVYQEDTIMSDAGTPPQAMRPEPWLNPDISNDGVRRANGPLYKRAIIEEGTSEELEHDVILREGPISQLENNSTGDEGPNEQMNVVDAQEEAPKEQLINDFNQQEGLDEQLDNDVAQEDVPNKQPEIETIQEEGQDDTVLNVPVVRNKRKRKPKRQTKRQGGLEPNNKPKRMTPSREQPRPEQQIYVSERLRSGIGKRNHGKPGESHQQMLTVEGF